MQNHFKQNIKNHDTDFSNWLRKLWISNCDERDEYKEPKMSMQQYWHQYKWWLRREYKFQRARNENMSV
jgi:hypothetical protein